jgi:hypothetical protein
MVPTYIIGEMGGTNTPITYMQIGQWLIMVAEGIEKVRRSMEFKVGCGNEKDCVKGDEWKSKSGRRS